MREGRRWEEAQGSAKDPGTYKWREDLVESFPDIKKKRLRMTRINLSPLLAKLGNTFIFSQSSGTLGLF